MKRGVWLLALCSACAGTEIGNPAGMDGGMEVTPILDSERIVTTEDGTRVRIEGGPGAVEPPDSEVRTAGMMEAGDFESAEVEADGSFSLLFEPGTEAIFILQGVRGAQLSDPLLVSTALAPSALTGCLGVGRAIDVGTVAPGEVPITLTNSCEQSVDVSAALHPLSVGAVSVQAPPSVDAASSADLILQVSGAGETRLDALVVLELQAFSFETLVLSIHGMIEP